MANKAAEFRARVATPTRGLDMSSIQEALGNVSRSYVYKLITAGELRTFRLGRRRLATPEAVGELISRLEREANAA